jgi:hypothetical protein
MRNAVGTRDCALVQSTSVSELSWQDPLAAPGVTHTFAVSAISDLGEGPKAEVQYTAPSVQDRDTVLSVGVGADGRLRVVCGARGGLVLLEGGAVEEEAWAHVAVVKDADVIRCVERDVGEGSCMCVHVSAQASRVCG